MIFEFLALLASVGLGCRGGEGFVRVVDDFPLQLRREVVVTLRGDGVKFEVAGERRVPGGLYRVEVPNQVTVPHPLAPVVYQVHLVSAPAVCLMADRNQTIQLRHSLVPTTGKLWFASRQEVAAIDVAGLTEAGKGSFVPAFSIHLPPESGEQIQDIGLDRKGNLWVAYNRRVVRYSPFNLRRPSLVWPMQEEVRRLEIGPDDRLWVAHPSGVYIYEEGKGVKVADISQPLSLAFSPQGEVWVGQPGTIFRIGQDKRLSPAIVWKQDNRPDDLAFDKQGNLWILADSRVVLRFDQGSLERPSRMFFVGAFGRATGFLVDDTGQLWVSYGRAGIWRLSEEIFQQKDAFLVPLDNFFPVAGSPDIHRLAVFRHGL
ncbi:MAG: hypothetical protein QXD60_02330 [Nanopusillaceae archaeon]